MSLLFKDTIFITVDDDIYFFIENSETYIVDKYNIENILNIIRNNVMNKNIIIDSRLTEGIIYSFIYYDVNVLIYNIVDNTIMNIFNWGRLLLQLNTNTFNVVYMKKMLFLYLFVTYYLHNISNISWKNKFAEKIIMNDKEYCLTKSYIINYINVTSSMECNNDLLFEVNNILTFHNLQCIKPIDKTFTINDIQSTLKKLCYNNNIICC